MLGIALFVVAGVAIGSAAERYTVSISAPQVPAGQSVVSFEINLVGASFVNIINVPRGWQVAIDNDPSWQTSIKGSVLVGAAWVSPAALAKMRFVIERSPDPKLTLKLSGTIASSKNYDTTTNVTLTTKDFKLEPVK